MFVAPKPALLNFSQLQIDETVASPAYLSVPGDWCYGLLLLLPLGGECVFIMEEK